MLGQRLVISNSPVLARSDGGRGSPQEVTSDGCRWKRVSRLVPEAFHFSFRECLRCNILQPRDCTIISRMEPKQVTISKPKLWRQDGGGENEDEWLTGGRQDQRIFNGCRCYGWHGRCYVLIAKNIYDPKHRKTYYCDGCKEPCLFQPADSQFGSFW